MVFEGVLLLSAATVVMGSIGLTSEKSLEVLNRTDLAKKPIIKKALNTVGIEVLQLTEEKRMAVLDRLDYYAKEFAEGWEEGKRNSFKIPLRKLGINDEAIGVKRELEKLRDRLVYLPSVEEIELAEDEYNLIVTVDENVLIACYEAQLDEWKTQGQLERYEYKRSRGVI